MTAEMTAPMCEWFVRCERESVGTAWHPVLGVVPICQPCADRMGQDVDPFDDDDDA